MIEMLKNNPAVLMGTLAAFDLIGLVCFIIYTIKNSPQGKRLKKIVTVCSVFVVLDVIISVCIVTSNTYYDKLGNSYHKPEDVIYYDRDNTPYHLTADDKGRDYLVSDNGIQTYSASRIYIDKDGFIVYDRKNEFKQSDRKYIFCDTQGKEYYSIDTVQWNKSGQIKLEDNN